MDEEVLLQNSEAEFSMGQISQGSENLFTKLQFSKIATLSFGANNLKLQDVKMICDSIRKNQSITSLKIRNIANVEGEKLLTTLVHLPNISRLDISSVQSSPCAFINVFKNNFLKTLKINESNLPSLSNWESHQIEELTQNLEENKSLKHLDISINKFRKESFDILADAISINSSLEEIVIFSNHCLGIDQFHFQRIFQSKSIQSIDMQGMKFTNENMTYFCEVLSENKTLKSLNLSHSVEKEFGLFFESLLQNDVIEKLILTNMSTLFDPGDCFNQLIHYIENTKSLKFLDLSDNFFDDYSVKRVVKSLSDSSIIHLKMITWDTMEHDDEVLEDLLLYISQNHRLQYLESNSFLFEL
jgi:hypothetical protein